MKKLLGVPEVQSGTEHKESNIVIKTLEKWEVRKEAIAVVVFDTTHSCSGINSGACLFVDISGKTYFMVCLSPSLL